MSEPWRDTRDPLAERQRIIRHRNLALALVLVFFVVMFFAITVVKMRNPHLPSPRAGTAAAASASGGASHAQ